MSLPRLYVLRAFYLLLVIGGFFVVPSALTDSGPAIRGMLPSMLAGLWLCALIGLRHPLHMLPVLLFELASKIIWMIAHGVRQGAVGVTASQLSEDFSAIGAQALLLAAVIPWTYVFRHYVNEPGARWR